MSMTYGPLDESRPLGPSEYDDDGLGWAGKGDLGISMGRQPTAGESAALRRAGDATADMERLARPDVAAFRSRSDDV
jgi:hypothetical protein